MQSLLWLNTFTGEGLDDIKLSELPFDVSYSYRLFTSFTEQDPIGKREDVIAPSYAVKKQFKKRARLLEEPCIRLFYQGGEEDLSRFIYWLRNVHLSQDTDDPAPIYLGCQPTHLAQKELQTLYPKVKLCFVGPGELEHYGILSGYVDALDEDLFF